MTLKDLEIGKTALVRSVGGSGAVRRHLLDMGVIPGTAVTVVKLAPMGDPMELSLHNYSLTLRLAEAALIAVEEIVPERHEEEPGRINEEYEFLHEHNAHPGIGEEGKYHSKEDECPLPKESTLTFALAGQQNSGKTTHT